MWKKYKTWFSGLAPIATGVFALLVFQPDAAIDVNASRIIRAITNEFIELEAAFGEQIDVLNEPGAETRLKWKVSRHWFYIFQNDSLKYWSTNRMVPKLVKLSNDPLQYYEDAGWNGIVRRWDYGKGASLIVFVPIIYNPPIKNQYTH